MTKTDDAYMTGLMSTLKTISEQAVAEYQRKRLPHHDDELDKIKSELADNPLRFRGYSIRTAGGMWIVTSPVHASYTWEFQSLGEALAYINTTLAEPF